jgi:orotate phosphoribosyltransferase
VRGDELLALYEREGALLRGHFVLRSGMHADRYLQSALLLAKPDLAARAGKTLAEALRASGATTVLSPALGGVVIGHETAKALGVRFFFAERRGEEFLLRRGFRLEPGEPVAIVEDVVTTGGSVLAVLRLAAALGARPVAIAALVDRSEGKARFSVPFHPASRLPLAAYAPEECPLCRAGVPVEKPGSRGIHD